MTTPSDPHRPLEPGQSWAIGGQDRQLSPTEQLEQLGSYLEEHYQLPDFRPPWRGGSGDRGPADDYCARLPDRITHAAMLVLGSGLDHTMPGVAYTQGVTVEELSLPAAGATIIRPEHQASDTWVISLHSGGWWRGSGAARQMQWLPEVAAVANLAQVTAMDVDYPLAPEAQLSDMLAAISQAVAYAREQGAGQILLWGYSSGAALAAVACSQHPDLAGFIATYPDFAALAALPEQLRGGAELPEQLPPVLLQIADHDDVADGASAEEYLRSASAHLTVAHYPSRHRYSTPAVARQRVKATADALRNWQSTAPSAG